MIGTGDEMARLDAARQKLLEGSDPRSLWIGRAVLMMSETLHESGASPCAATLVLAGSLAAAAKDIGAAVDEGTVAMGDVHDLHLMADAATLMRAAADVFDVIVKRGQS